MNTIRLPKLFVDISLVLIFNIKAESIKNPDTVVKLVSTDWTTVDPAQCYLLSCGKVIHNMMNTLGGYDKSSTDLIPLITREVPNKANCGISKGGVYQIVNSFIQHSWLRERNFNLSTNGDYFYELTK